MTSTNFEFLRSYHRELADLGRFAERYAFSDATSAMVKLRTFAESLVKAVFAHHGFQMSYLMFARQLDLRPPRRQ